MLITVSVAGLLHLTHLVVKEFNEILLVNT